MSKKIIQTIVLLILLVGFPLVSWIYLRDGLNFRLNAIEALQPKANLPPSADTLHTEGIIVVWYDVNGPLKNRLDPIKAHFNDRTDVMFENFPNRSYPSVRDSLHKVMELTGRGRADIEDCAFLLGQEGKIRGSYLLDNDDQMGDLTEHIAFMVPLDPEKDFEFKRESEK